MLLIMEYNKRIYNSEYLLIMSDFFSFSNKCLKDQISSALCSTQAKAATVYLRCGLLSPQCAFLIWCMVPVTWNGSEMLYTKVIRPFFLKHQSTMDTVVSDLTAKAKNLTETVTKEGESLTRRRMHSTASQ